MCKAASWRRQATDYEWTCWCSCSCVYYCPRISYTRCRPTKQTLCPVHWIVYTMFHIWFVSCHASFVLVVGRQTVRKLPLNWFSLKLFVFVSESVNILYILSIQSNICVYLCMPACLCVYRTHRISGSTWLTKHTAKSKSCFQNWHESWHGGFRYSFPSLSLSLFQNRFLIFSFLRPNCG